MIPADHIHDNGDGTLWLTLETCGVNGGCAVVPGCLCPLSIDRSCDTCDGRGVMWGGYSGIAERPCSYCHGTGRDVFDIKHYQPCSCVGGLHEQGRCEGAWPLTKRVHVVPGMVLPIVDDYDESGPFPLIVQDEDLQFYLVTAEDEASGFDGVPITLPPAAEPGMYAIQLQIIQ